MSPPTPPARANQPSPVKFTGSLTPEQRARVLKLTDLILRGRGSFAKGIGSRLELVDVSVYERHEDGKMHAEVAFEIDVDEGNHNRVPRACCHVRRTTSSRFTESPLDNPPRGARLRIVNKTVSFGARTVSVRTEIWDTTNRRLVATGIHNQMTPSEPKL
uniref:Cytochrome P450 monooxygenase AKT7 ) n=1 Tax=Ganoderma boninense TaxID=34458 RepID=A0A5K1JU91_9APHY|nr:Cytochrome P450 monooxygenase AKT7 (EC (AK-toxin biosynthesis protein 7) [Ganoderma boninense]